MSRHTKSSAEKSRFWQGHIDGLRRSGLTQRDYCESRNLALSTFQLWRRRLASGRVVVTPARSECVDLVPIPRAVANGEMGRSRQPAVVVCVGRYRVEVSDGVHVNTLRCVIDALEAR